MVNLSELEKMNLSGERVHSWSYKLAWYYLRGELVTSRLFPFCFSDNNNEIRTKKKKSFGVLSHLSHAHLLLMWCPVCFYSHNAGLLTDLTLAFNSNVLLLWEKYKFTLVSFIYLMSLMNISVSLQFARIKRIKLSCPGAKLLFNAKQKKSDMLSQSVFICFLSLLFDWDPVCLLPLVSSWMRFSFSSRTCSICSCVSSCSVRAKRMSSTMRSFASRSANQQQQQQKKHMKWRYTFTSRTTCLLPYEYI